MKAEGRERPPTCRAPGHPGALRGSLTPRSRGAGPAESGLLRLGLLLLGRGARHRRDRGGARSGAIC